MMLNNLFIKKSKDELFGLFMQVQPSGLNLSKLGYGGLEQAAAKISTRNLGIYHSNFWQQKPQAPSADMSKIAIDYSRELGLGRHLDVWG